MNFWGFKRIMFFILAIIFVAVLNFEILKVYLLSNYIGGWDGMTHFAFSKYYSENIFPSVFGWIPTWFSGMPFPQFYPPFFYYSFAFLNNLLNIEPNILFKFLALFCFFVPSFVLGYLYFHLIDSKTDNYKWVVLFSFLFMSFDTKIMGSGFGLQSIFNTGTITHSFSFLFFGFWIFYTYKLKEKIFYKILSIFFLSILLLTNVHITFTCLFLYLIFFIKDCFELEKRNFKNIFQVFSEYFLIGFTSLLLVSFWYIPMIYFYDFSAAKSLGYPWGSISDFMLRNSYVVFLSFVVIAKMFYEKKITFLSTIGIFSLLVFFLLKIDFSSTNLPIHVDRQIAPVVFLLPIMFVGVISFLGIKISKIIFATVFIVLIILKPIFFDQDLVKGLYDIDEDYSSLLEKVENINNKLFLIEVYLLGAPIDSVFNSVLGNNDNRTVYAIFRESSVTSIFFTPIRNQFSSEPEFWGIRSRLSLDEDFLNQNIKQKIENAKSIGVNYFIKNTESITDDYSKSKEIKSMDIIGEWKISEFIYEENEDSNFEILKNKPILVFSEFDTKNYRDRGLDYISLAEHILERGEYDTKIVLRREELNDKLEEFSFIFIDEQFLTKNKKILNDLLSKNNKTKIFVPKIDSIDFDYTDERIVLYDSPNQYFEDDYYLEYLFELFKENLIKQEIPQYNQVVFEEKDGVFTIRNQSDKDLQLLIKRSYFPTFKTFSGQSIKQINPNFMLINLKANQSEVIYFEYPKVFYISHFISLFGIFIFILFLFRLIKISR